MKIVVFGASGHIGQRILQEALRRGHSIKGVACHPAKLIFSHPQLILVAGDMLQAETVAREAAGYDAVISAIGPAQGEDPRMVIGAAEALIEGLKRAGVRRLVVVGGAGSLEVAPGMLLMDAPDFPPAWRPVAEAAAVPWSFIASREATSTGPTSALRPSSRRASARGITASGPSNWSPMRRGRAASRWRITPWPCSTRSNSRALCVSASR
jgi:putative NADH-flavin reductase